MADISYECPECGLAIEDDEFDYNYNMNDKRCPQCGSKFENEFGEKEK